MAVSTTWPVIRRKAAGDLGLLIETTIDAVVDGDTITVNKLADVAPNPEVMRDAFVYNIVDQDFTRVTKFYFPTNNNVDVARSIFTGDAGEAIEFYFLLDPDEWLRCANEVLRGLWYIDRVEVTLLANTHEYALATWIQTSGDIIDVRLRDTTPSPPVEEPAPSWELFEDANALTLKLHTLPVIRGDNNQTVVVKGRHRYAELVNDSSSTLCPEALLIPGLVLAAAEKIFKKRGDALKRNFGQTLIVAKEKFLKARHEYMPAFLTREYAHTDPFNPSTDIDFDWGW